MKQIEVSEEHMLAVNIAGRAVISLIYRGKTKSICIDPRKKEYSLNPDNSVRDELGEILVNVIYGEIDGLCMEKIERELEAYVALKYAGKIAEDLINEKKWSLTDESNKDVEFHTNLLVQSIYLRKNSNWEIHSVIREYIEPRFDDFLEKLRERVVEKVTEILKHHVDVIKTIASKLMKEKKVAGKVLTEIFEDSLCNTQFHAYPAGHIVRKTPVAARNNVPVLRL